MTDPDRTSPAAPPPHGETPPGFDMAEYRRRQRSRSRIMGAGLLALAALFFFITIAKIGLFG